jgi:hypothetical protein
MSEVDQHIGEGAGMHPSYSLNTSKNSSKGCKNLSTRFKEAFKLRRSKIVAGTAFLSILIHSYEAQAFFQKIQDKLSDFTRDFTKLCIAGIVITLIVQITMLAFRKMNNPMLLAWPIGAGVLLTVLDQIRMYFWN